MEGGKISVQFPQYYFTAEIIDTKLVMVRKPVDLLTSVKKKTEMSGSGSFSFSAYLG